MSRIIRAICWRIRAGFALLSARRRSEAALRRPDIRRVLVVCFGNIYRSAFTGEYLKMRLGPEVEIRSAGFYDRPDRPAPDRHLRLARSHGVDLARHRSRVVEPADLQWADIVVLMDRNNWIRLRRMNVDPQKLVWLAAFAPGSIEIDDPYGMNDAQAAALVERLAHCSERFAARLGQRR